MSNPPEISPEKKKVPRRVVEDVGRIRGALSDTTHLLKSFKDSLGDIVVANKAASASIEELVGVCKEERREIKVAMEKIDQHIQQQSNLPSELASLRSLSSTAASEQTLTSKRLEKVESVLVDLSTRVTSSANSSTQTHTTLSKLAQTQTDLSTAVLQLSSTVTQISHSQTQISQTQARMLVILQRLDARPSAPPSSPGVDQRPNIYVKILDGVAGVIEGSGRKRRRDWEDGESGWDEAGSTRGGERIRSSEQGEGSRERSESARSEGEGGSEKRLRTMAGMEQEEEEEVDQLASSSSEDHRQVALNDPPPARSESGAVQYGPSDMGRDSRSAWRDLMTGGGGSGGGGFLPSSSFDQIIPSSSPRILDQRSSPETYATQQPQAAYSISLPHPNRGSSSFAIGSSPPRNPEKEREREMSGSTTSSASKKKPLVRRKRKEKSDEDIIPFTLSPESPIASKPKSAPIQPILSIPMAQPLSNHNFNPSPTPAFLVAGPSKSASTSTIVVGSKHPSPSTPLNATSPLISTLKHTNAQLNSNSSTSSSDSKPGPSIILPATATPSSASLHHNPITPLPSSTSIPVLKRPTPASASSKRRQRILIAEDSNDFVSQSPSASQSEIIDEDRVAAPPPPLSNLFNDSHSNGNSLPPPSAPAQPKRKRMLLMGGAGSTQEDEDNEEVEMKVDGEGIGLMDEGRGGRGDAGLKALEKAMREDEEEGIGSQLGSGGGRSFGG